MKIQAFEEIVLASLRALFASSKELYEEILTIYSLSKRPIIDDLFPSEAKRFLYLSAFDLSMKAPPIMWYELVISAWVSLTGTEDFSVLIMVTFFLSSFLIVFLMDGFFNNYLINQIKKYFMVRM